MHLSVQLGAKALGVFYGGSDFDLSPDGRWLVYQAEHDGTHSLFLQDIRDATGRFIKGTDGARGAFFSFDNQWIAFSSGKTLKKVPVTGGSPVSICDLPVVTDVGDFGGGVWAPDHRIFFVPLFNAGIWVVSANGGTPQVFLKINEGADRIAYTLPQLLPGNKGLLFTLSPAHAITTDDEQIGIIEPGAAEPRVLLRGVTQARYVPTGHLIYSYHGALLAVRFDLAKLAITGSPVSVIDGIESGLLWDSRFSISKNGTLVYEPKGNIRGGSRLAVVDRNYRWTRITL
jgi:WD40-like Beta Propeller Repeat